MTTTTALQLFDAGYKALVSVVPPGAKLSTRSEIPDGSDPAKPDQRGKAPGKFDGNRGDWAGYNWREFEPLRAHIELWEKAGANIGLHAKAFPAVDIDCMDPDLVREIVSIAQRLLGDAPQRVGRAPKTLLVYGTAAPFTRMRLHLKRGEEKGLIEILGDGQQYLVAGTHPGTMKPYEWIGTPLHEWDPLDDLNLVNRDSCERFFDEVEEVVDILGWSCEREGKSRLAGENGMVQEALAAPSLEAARAAVAALPNTSELFPSRDAMNQVGYAIKASCGDAGLELFQEWAGRWADGVNDPDYVAHEWDRMIPPFRVGWEWLVGQAKQLGGYDDAGDEFDETLPAPSDFDFDALQAPPAPPAPPSGPGSAPAAAAPADSPPPKYSDQAAADMFCHEYGNTFVYVEPMGGWQMFAKGAWALDETHKVEAAAKKVCRVYADKANNDATLNQAVRRGVVMGLTKTGTVANILRMARSDKRVCGPMPRDFDANLDELNTPAGVVNLVTGELAPHNNKSWHTKITSAGPQAGAPTKWLKFLEEALGGDQELIDFMQTLAGYWLTGHTTEQQFTFIWGPGGNGKGVFANTIADVMGDYATRTPSDTFASTRNAAHPEAMARLRGARLVLTTEVQEGQAWDEAKVKTATGGDVIAARFMNQNSFEFAPHFKLLFLGNHKPRIRNIDAAMKRRIHLVPMTITPRRVNKRLPLDLKAEWPQILQWAIDGAKKWHAEGELKVPRAVRAATEEYFGEEDIVGQFLAETCDLSHHTQFEATVDLFEAWSNWATHQGEHVRTQTWLSRQLNGRPGVVPAKHPITRAQRGFLGVKLLTKPGEFDAVQRGSAQDPARAK
jgi:P4 family phage/plasmid primase-like protien